MIGRSLRSTYKPLQRETTFLWPVLYTRAFVLNVCWSAMTSLVARTCTSAVSSLHGVNFLEGKEGSVVAITFRLIVRVRSNQEEKNQVQ
jgi:hypothetical protein